MKIGFSFGRCVRSIVLGEVSVDDVLCIIARTNMRDVEGVKFVCQQYGSRHDYLAGLDMEKCIQVGVELWTSGKIIEPRTQGVGVIKVPAEYVWMDLFPTISDTQSDAVKTAWETYRMLITLTEQLPEDEGSTSSLQHSDKYEPPKNEDGTIKEIDPGILAALIV